MGFETLVSNVHKSIKKTFGEAIVYEPLSGGSFTIDGVFNTKHTFLDPDTEQVVSSNQPTLGIRQADMVAEPVKGDFVTIREKKYRVHDSQEDGEGWTNLFLYEV